MKSNLKSMLLYYRRRIAMNELNKQSLLEFLDWAGEKA
jgi:hypothetical protein